MYERLSIPTTTTLTRVITMSMSILCSVPCTVFTLGFGTTVTCELLRPIVATVCCTVLLISASFGQEGPRPSKESLCPSKETVLYLGQLLRVNEPGATGLGVTLAQAYTPIELLFEQEVLRKRFGSYRSRTASVDLIFVFPEKCSYLTEARREWIKIEGNHYSIIPTQSIRAYAVVRQESQLNGGTVEVLSTTVEATFHEQTDSNKDGVWDRETCWEVGEITEKVTRIKNPPIPKIPAGQTVSERESKSE